MIPNVVRTFCAMIGPVRLTGLGVLLPLWISACQTVEPQQTADFSADRLAKIRIGTSRTEVLAALGAPLSGDGGSRNFLEYATPGARWMLGEYRTDVRGYECAIWLDRDMVTAARVFDAAAGKLCECNTEACPQGWAEPCAPKMPSGAVQQ